MQYQNFLNSLEFTVQFFIESRELDIRPYIALLEERLNAELDDLMRIHIRESIAFIKDFTERANIMSKNYYLVVPYDPALGFVRSARPTLWVPAYGNLALLRKGFEPRGGTYAGGCA